MNVFGREAFEGQFDGRRRLSMRSEGAEAGRIVEKVSIFLMRSKEWRSSCGDGREVALDATSAIGSAGKND
jgi:hypothetical protein